MKLLLLCTAFAFAFPLSPVLAQQPTTFQLGSNAQAFVDALSSDDPMGNIGNLPWTPHATMENVIALRDMHDCSIIGYRRVNDTVEHVHLFCKNREVRHEAITARITSSEGGISSISFHYIPMIPAPPPARRSNSTGN